MKTIPLPDSLNAQSIADSADFIIDFDQWDDWAPDPVYLADVAADRAGFVKEAQALQNKGSIGTDQFYPVDIYSNDNLKFRAAAIPFPERVLITATICAHAGSIQRELLADRLDGLQFRPSKRRATYEWTGDMLGVAWRAPDGSPWGQVDPLTAVTRSSKPPLFSALDDGLYTALINVGQWLRNIDPWSGSTRAVHWRDVRGFYGNISRPQLWGMLDRFGFKKDTLRFLEEVSRACGITGDTGIPPLDDAWGFLANAYLLPVDRALSGSGRQFRRCADEYFLFAGDEKDQVAAERLLTTELAKLRLTLNPDKRADLVILIPLGEGEVRTLAADAFFLKIRAAMTSPYVPKDLMVNANGWQAMLKESLSVEPGKAPHARTMTLVRAMHFARERAVLNLPDDKAGSSTRARQYSEVLAAAGWLPGLLRRRLQDAVRVERTWPCLWMLALASDLGPRGAPAFDVARQIATGTQTDPLLRAHALLTMAKIGDRDKTVKLLDQIRPSGQDMADRTNLLALYFAEKRWGGEWMSRIDSPQHSRLRRYLLSRKGKA